ncbi:D-alanine--D-alanine ligase [Streptococcus macacae]|uniref:D-alanine--D-alanine ligase n=1 Tax=Streptococcus macacae NCTC 11558 TaxID=764298 RepID=G5JVV3_9STRE|nr:D-alanine--D-alanine ligase [Streptococcus macacae]EHJ51721.1 D-ala D-ala ligase N-terminal domain protein [Streptococcus macacae NCTC 11558]SUN78943.1 D-alanine--D-alanine ligase [Streptococcus macacae NCTC 11558]
MKKETLILLYGGRSAEREVSVLSAESIIQAVNYDKFLVKTYFITQTGHFIKTQEFSQLPLKTEKLMTNDTVIASQKIKPSDIYEKGAVVFPILHGPMGEDGSVQGFLEILKMPYVGTNILSSALAMDKIATKQVLESSQNQIPQVPYITYFEGEDLSQTVFEAENKLTYPVFVKPANMGSSVGISKARNQTELKTAIALALKYDSRILIEEGVKAREIEVGILGNTEIKTTLPGEVVKNVAFYDYEAKYIDNQIKMAIPAEVSEEISAKMRQYAKLAFQMLGGCGLSRCDFFLTEDGHIYLNELNTMPGFTQWSMYPLLWENMGLSYSDLIERLVMLAKEKFDERENHLL